MIVTYQKDEWLENDTDNDEYQTRSKFLNYESSVIKDASYTNGHFKESNVTANDSYTYNLKDFDMIKAVQDERAHPGLTNKKELAIWLAIDYIASSNIEVEVGDGGLPIDFESKFSRIINSQWATDMYNTYGDDVTLEDYIKPHIMDGYIKREDYPYISTGYLKCNEMAFSGNYSSDEDSSDGEYNHGDPLPVEIKSPKHVGKK